MHGRSVAIKMTKDWMELPLLLYSESVAPWHRVKLAELKAAAAAHISSEMDCRRFAGGLRAAGLRHCTAKA